jgi:hypothetical protein
MTRRNSAIKSELKMRNQILGLISARTAEEFLTDLANLHGPGSWPDIPATESEWKSLDRELGDGMRRMQHRYPNFLGNTSIDITTLRDFLRRAWQATDPRAREWWCFQIREAYMRKVRLENRVALEGEEAVFDFFPRDEDLMPDVPPITAFEAALFHFQHQAKRARRCRNLECPAPYFFASKKNQKFCDTSCSQPARRESNRIWWQVNRGKSKRRK